MSANGSSRHRTTRRRFLGAAAAAPAFVRGLAAEVAHAQTGEPTILIEMDLRDQLDWGHVMVAPGLATDASLKRGERGRQAALFHSMNELVRTSTGVYLTPESKVLEPHIDSIAMLELCELTDGPVHGHEAGNAIRSPGRRREQGGGRMPMWTSEPGGNNSEGAFYSSTPTPMGLHNHFQKKVTAGLRNGVVIKGTQRPFAMYHFAAGLPGGEADRVQNVDSLLKAFPPTTTDLSALNVLPSGAEADALVKYLDRVDGRLLEARGIASAARVDHKTQLADAKPLLHSSMQRSFNLALTDAEKTYWSAGMPPRGGRTTIDVWAMAAYAFKLAESGVVRSVAYEVDIGDVHGERTRPQMRDQTLITVLPLLRLIESLKRAGLYDRTLILAYTTDGGRAPAAGSSGDEGKNGAILAGGMIKGGYYGDIRNAGPDGDGQKYAYHMPDLATGAPIATGTTGKDKRVPGAALWRTIAKALKIPDALAASFPDVAAAKPLSFMLRS